MMKSVRKKYKKKKHNIIKDVRNLFSLKNEIIQDIKNLFKLKKRNTIRPYLKVIINVLKKAHTWKIQLTIATNFISSKDNDEKIVMHSKSITYKLCLMIKQLKL